MSRDQCVVVVKAQDQYSASRGRLFNGTAPRTVQLSVHRGSIPILLRTTLHTLPVCNPSRTHTRATSQRPSTTPGERASSNRQPLRNKARSTEHFRSKPRESEVQFCFEFTATDEAEERGARYTRARSFDSIKNKRVASRAA